METFGDKLRQARQNKDLLQSDVAEKLGCAPTSLTNWEKNKVQPSLDILSQLCDIYEISALSLLERTYSYDDVINISRKPVPQRTYEERIALNFSAPILNNLLFQATADRGAVNTVKQLSFIDRTDSVERFNGTITGEGIDRLVAEYDANGEIDNDILFLYHALKPQAKCTLLAMLNGLADTCLIEDFFGDGLDTMTHAAKYTSRRILEKKRKLEGAMEASTD